MQSETERVETSKKQEACMVSEIEFFYVVLLTLLVVMINALLAATHRRHDRHSRS
jgi:hypothetical protein